MSDEPRLPDRETEEADRDDDDGALDAEDLEGEGEPRVVSPVTAPLIGPD